jgi:hypothetical protein
MMKLNGWQRIGIVASVVWAIGAYVHELGSSYGGAVGVYSLIHEDCVERSSTSGMESRAQCDQELDKSIAESSRSAREVAAFVAIVPIPLGWGFAYLLIFIVRWVKRGFSPVPPVN